MISDGALTVEAAREILEMLRNVSHDDLDDEYAGPCPFCGAKQYYNRDVPRAQRTLRCRNEENCPGPSE